MRAGDGERNICFVMCLFPFQILFGSVLIRVAPTHLFVMVERACSEIFTKSSPPHLNFVPRMQFLWLPWLCIELKMREFRVAYLCFGVV